MSNITIAGRAFSRDDVKLEAEHVMREHDPANQAHSYDRCEHCHYTRHPCDTYWMAAAVQQLIKQLEGP